jgi:hypothetical protein
MKAYGGTQITDLALHWLNDLFHLSFCSNCCARIAAIYMGCQIMPASNCTFFEHVVLFLRETMTFLLKKRLQSGCSGCKPCNRSATVSGKFL